MTGATLAASLVERGLDPRELESKAALFDLVLSAIAPHQRSGLHAWWVPGRLEVFGKHTDYAGGRTLVCAVPRGFAVVARSRADGVLHVVDTRRGQDVRRAPSHSPAMSPPYTGWRHYVDVVASRLSRNFPAAPLGADIVIASDLPRASGMSSSSALVIAIATALARVGALDRRAEWQESIAGPRDVAGYFACIENGLSFGSLSGDSGVGTHGGSEDHAAILTGVPGRLAAFAFVPMRAFAIVAVPERWRFVLSPCGIRAQKTGAAREAYNRLAGGTQVLLDLWNIDSPEAAPSLGAALLNSGNNREDIAATSPAAADRLRALVRGSAIPGWSRDALEKRLDHFIDEDARIPEAVDAFRHADGRRIGRLAESSQADAEMLLGNQIPETSALARTARELGAFASCSFGAGFGGSVWALVEHDRADAFARRWHADAFVAAPGPPVVELSVARR
jgi:galactokinase